MPLSSQQIQQLADEYANRGPREILRLALESYDNIAISFSGAEDVVLIDLALKLNKEKLKKDIQVFSLDTGRLHPETLRFIEQVRNHYDIDIEVLSPDHETLEAFVKEKGLFSFYQDGHQECCGIRKVEPLRRKLQTVDAWITGQRHDQSPDTRAEVPVIQEDSASATPEHPLVKFNPLANWSSEQVWAYITDNEVPFNELHKRGYISIGCEPCTRAVLPNEHERAGRWWWEESTKKECGLHAVNFSDKEK